MIYARRHFVGTRSAGAGEVWMYHASGAAGTGVQVTRRDNDQKDAGEPALYDQQLNEVGGRPRPPLWFVGSR